MHRLCPVSFDGFIWNEECGREVRLKQLWEYLAQYCYLPRLFDQQVPVEAIKNGVGRPDAPFAYATGRSSEGHHTGLVYRTLGPVYFDETSLVIHPEHVVKPPGEQPDAEV